MASDVAAVTRSAPPTILDRYKALIRERGAGDIVRHYELLLLELTFNSKPIITDLTIIAGDHRDHADGIADAICARIIEVPGEQKLPSLYLLDSIVKNIGHDYVKAFSSRLPEVFVEAYRQIHPNLYPSMRHLFGTWSTVFPLPVLRRIEALLQFSPSGPTSLRDSESPRTTHGIHVNPNYLEARRKFEDTTAGNLQARGYGNKIASGYDEHGSNTADPLLSNVAFKRMTSSQAGRTSLPFGADKLLPSSISRVDKPSSSFRTGHGRPESPQGDEFLAEYKLGRMTGRGEQPNDRPMNIWPGGAGRFETSTVFNNRVELEGPRALIDAYGNDQRSKTLEKNKPLKVDTNGIGSKVGKKTWQNTEEEEFDWEDMSLTVVDHSRANGLQSPSVPPLEGFSRIKPGYETKNGVPFDTHIRRIHQYNLTQNSMVKDSSKFTEDVVPSFNYATGSKSKIPGSIDETMQFSGSHRPQEVRSLPPYLLQSSDHLLNPEGSNRKFQTLASSGGEHKPLINNFSDADTQVHLPPAIASRRGPANNDLKKFDGLSAGGPQATGTWPPISTLPPLPPPSQSQGLLDSKDASYSIMNQGVNNSSFPEHQYNSNANNGFNSTRPPLFPNQQKGQFPLRSNTEQANSVQPQLLVPQNVRPNVVPPAVVSMPSVVPPLPQGYAPQGHNTSGINAPPYPFPGVLPPFSYLNPPVNPVYMQGGNRPPSHLGPRTFPPQVMPPPPGSSSVAPNSQSGSAFSGLINSLMAQGLISVTNPSPSKDSVGLDFNPDVLKVRHESAITALYGDLPRQCKTCGLRFKSQEEHSSHMDWHVTKNRISKNRKQNPSRKWFVSVSMWLTGAEALGTEAVPGFLPVEDVVEKKDDEEFSVPAEEDQNTCALCGEPFDDFYSDETDEWMYKGAVYMNAPSGSMGGMDRSLLGPIVHVKCRSDSTVVPPTDFGREGGFTEEGKQKKRLRT